MKNTSGPSKFHDHGQAAHKHVQTPKNPRGDVAKVTSEGKTANKIKVRNHGPRSVRDVPYPYVNPEYVQDNFARKYHFRKMPTGRSPVHGWEHEHLLKAEHQDPSIHPLERAMVHKEPHNFGHGHGRGGVQGRLRISGSHKAHQIGKRKGRS